MSLSDSDRQQIRTRNRYRRALAHIDAIICAENAHHIEPEVCKAANIRREPLSIDQNSDCMPLFFRPFEGELETPEPEEDYQYHYEPNPYEPETDTFCNVHNARGNVSNSLRNRWTLDSVSSFFMPGE